MDEAVRALFMLSFVDHLVVKHPPNSTQNITGHCREMLQMGTHLADLVEHAGLVDVGGVHRQPAGDLAERRATMSTAHGRLAKNSRSTDTRPGGGGQK